MQSISTTAPLPSTGVLSRFPAVLALSIGLLMVYGAGFAQPSAIHNATHDTRHAFGLPCH